MATSGISANMMGNIDFMAAVLAGKPGLSR